MDATVPIGRFLTAGVNYVAIQVSSHTVYGGGILFQKLSLVPSAGDARRDPRQYAVAMLFAGLLAAFSLHFIGKAYRDSARGYAWLAGAALSAVIALAAEVGRAFFDYPYPWHAFRLLLIWAGLVAASAAVGRFFAAYFSASRWPLFVGAAAASAAFCLAPDADTKMAAGVAILLSSACVILLLVRGEQRGRAAALAAFIVPWIGLLIAAPSDALDNAIYVFFALLLAALAVLPTLVSGAAPEGRNSLHRKLTIDGMSFAPEDVRAVHAAGNYSQVEFVDGSERLLRAPLKTFAEAVPALIRTHRSHLVRLDGHERLKRDPARRRTLLLSDSGGIPVSRSYLASLQDLLGLRGSS